MRYFFIASILTLILVVIGTSCTSISFEKVPLAPLKITGLLCFWDFQNITDDGYVSKGPFNYILKPKNGPIARDEVDGIFGRYSLDLKFGQWLLLRRIDCPALNISGDDHVSIVAWIKRESDNDWQYIAGMWNERDAKRQYALFTCAAHQTNYKTFTRVRAKCQVHGYVSDVGGATPGKPYCFSYASGNQELKINQWYMIGFTYDHRSIKVYVNGILDYQQDYNPFTWDKLIFDGGKDGADFTVARQPLPNWPNYPNFESIPLKDKRGFDGKLGGLAVYNRALSQQEFQNLYVETMVNGKNNISE